MEYYNWAIPGRNSRAQTQQRKTLRKPPAPDVPVALPSAPVELSDVNTEFTSLRLLRTSLLFQTKEFFNHSTLHGVRYIAEVNRPASERLMWFCFTIVGLISAFVIIGSLWEKFQTNPTITGLDMDVHNSQLVFPTIVLCPMESYDLNRSYELANTKLGNHDEEATEVFQQFLIYLPQLSFENMKIESQHAENITVNEKYINAIDKESLRSYAFEVAVSCKDTFDVCKYRDEDITCCEHFFPIFSEHGFCFAFNPKYIDTPTGQVANEKFHELFETDKKWALLFTPKREAKIFVHSHSENFGWDFRPHVIWEPDFAAELLISMKQTYTTEDARQLSIRQRKCIFPDEMKLEYYSGEYIFTSCMMECRIKKSIKFCGCVPPFYRQIKNSKYCTVKDLKCLSRFAENITDVRDCNRCELSCANTVYEIEKLSKTTADPSKPLDTFVNVEYLTWPIIRYKREVLFGWVDLLVSFGGIAGLFLGFSLLSGVEIIYYFSLRACCMLYKNRGELYEMEKIKMQEEQPYIDLSLKLMDRSSYKANKDALALARVRKIDVAEINSRVGNDPTTAASDESLNQSAMNRMPIQMAQFSQQNQAIRNLQANRLATSYDYAQVNGPFYMP
ncbi:sodium channel protein Nach [Contarinia nasturtii]|uniref:sodium channel protein Nach n=1 Tax=Contarinia nasturtii TaxID=265458 RepID=UPI0012D3C91B|nr:sodium channel protein Nach [Contarinia nasturtii]